MVEPGKANPWKSWVRWVTWSFAACIVLAIVTPIAVNLLLPYLQTPGGALQPTSAFLLNLAGYLMLSFFAVGCVGGLLWSSFLAPPIAAGHLKHLAWRDVPRKRLRQLDFAPLTPAILAATVMFLLPALVVVLSIGTGDATFVRDFPWAGFFAWLLAITAVLIAVGWPIRRLTQRRFRRTLAAANVCVACGYNLHGTLADTCPECGEPIPGTAPAATSSTTA